MGNNGKADKPVGNPYKIHPDLFRKTIRKQWKTIATTENNRKTTVTP